MKNGSKQNYVFVDDLKLKEGDNVTYLRYYTDVDGQEWEEEVNCILDYYVDDNKISLKISNNKYVWTTKSDIVGKMRDPILSEAKITSIKKQIENLLNSISVLETGNDMIENPKEKTKRTKQIQKLVAKKELLERQLKEGTERIQVWITGYEPIEDEQ